MDRKFKEHLERASRIVASWPAWKQNVLQNALKPAWDKPRRPIVHERANDPPSPVSPRHKFLNAIAAAEKKVELSQATLDLEKTKLALFDARTAYEALGGKDH